MSAVENFGKILKELRRIRGLTQEDLAQQTGRSVDAISQWERCLNWPNFETLIRLGEALQVPVGKFFSEGDSNNEKGSERRRLELAIQTLINDLPDVDLEIAFEQIKALAGRKKR